MTMMLSTRRLALRVNNPPCVMRIQRRDISQMASSSHERGIFWRQDLRNRQQYECFAHRWMVHKDVRSRIFSPFSTAPVDNNDPSIKDEMLSTSKTQQRFDRLWQEKYELLREFVYSLDATTTLAKGDNSSDNEITTEASRSNNNIPPPPYPDNKTLVTWINKNRRQYHLKLMGKPNVLTDSRQRLLEDLGYPMKPREEFFERRVAELEAFVTEHGCFPYDLEEEKLLKLPDCSRLLFWCHNQRRQYKIWQNEINDDYENANDTDDDDDDSDTDEKQISSMTAERYEKLNAIGFCFDKHEATWQARYRDLKEYYRHHGNCLVPADYPANTTLAKWVSDQRYFLSRYLKGDEASMLPHRVELLSRIKFEHDARQARWLLRYQEYVDHVSAHGMARLPSVAENSPLRSWLKYQRIPYRAYLRGERTSMTEFRKKKLDELGFTILMRVETGVES